MISQSGIYLIRHVISGKVYVGQAKNLRTREQGHCWHLRNNRHHNRRLQFAWNKYGESGFKFEMVLICNTEHLELYEDLILKSYPKSLLYNFAQASRSSLGLKRSKKTREKIAAIWRGRRHTPETLVKMRGRKFTEEHKANIAKSWLKRDPISKEARAKMASALRGRKRSAKTRLKMSLTSMRPEIRAKRIEAARLRWAHRRV